MLRWIEDVAFDVLRHRIILSYASHAEGIKTDAINNSLIKINS